MTRRITIGYHGHCFDGMASAALTTRLLRASYEGPSEFRYRGFDHQPGGSYVPPEALDGDVNAVVDFRYTTAPELHWYFDHHPSGVQDEQQRAHLEADDSGRKVLDTSYGSCARLIADVAAERFGFEAPELSELVDWADVIDAARFPDPESAIRRDTPALELMMVVEAHGDSALLAPLIARLAEGAPLGEVAAEPAVRRRLPPLREQHERALEAVRRSARYEHGVVRLELPPELDGRYPKFAPYWLFPGCGYAVAVVPSERRVAISVGANPWAPEPRRHHVASLCARYGGGGHAAVGGITLGPGELERGREIAAELARELAS